ncbi:MAG: VanZ family protein [Bdellovibrionales bacterium]|nr:VanZ family protein [Bdellovibrionales bacterium]
MKTYAHKDLRYSIPLFSWLCLLWFGSGDRFSWQETAHWFGKVFFVSMSGSQISEWIHFCFRKAGHFVCYAMLSYLCLVAIDQTWNLSRKYRPKIAALIIVCCIFFAGIDEWRQSFTIYRSSSIFDVLIDGMGIIAVQSFFSLRGSQSR